MEDSLKEENYIQLNNFDNYLKSSVMPSYRSENLSIEINLSDGKFMDLIRLNNDNLFESRNEALEELNKYSDHHIAFVTFMGPKLTGKTYLLLKLLNIIPNTADYLKKNSCGVIKMWKNPLFLEHNNTYVFFLDTEGYAEDDPIKESVLLLSLIISSLVLVNTKYFGDYANDFRIFNNISKKFCVYNPDDHEDISSFLGRSLLIQRDFKINMNISNLNYMQTAYNIFEEHIKCPPELDEIRKIWVKLFKERDYMMCSVPIIEENLINNLIVDLGNKVTDEFNQELNKIRDKLMNQIKPKKLFNIMVKPKTMGLFIKELTKEINEQILKPRSQKGIVVISSAWKNAVENNCVDAYHDTCDAYYEELQRFFNEDKPRKRAVLFKLLSAMREECIENFYKSVRYLGEKNDIFLEYRKKLVDFLNEKETQIYMINQELQKDHSKECFNSYSVTLKEMASRKALKSANVEEFIENLKMLFNDYIQDACGPEKSIILIEGFKEINQEFMEALMNNYITDDPLESKKLAELDNEMRARLKKNQDLIKDLDELNMNLSLMHEKLKQDKSKLEDEINKLKISIENYVSTEENLTKEWNEILILKEELKKFNAEIDEIENELKIIRSKKKSKKCACFG